MDASINAKKVIKKRDRNRILKALAYVVGFPLLILIVFIGSVPFMNGAGFTANEVFGIKAAYIGVIVCVIAWVVIIIFQLIAALVTKSSTARGAIVVIATLIVMVGGTVYFDIWAEGKVNAARDAYVREQYGISEDTELIYLKDQSNNNVLTFQDDEYVKAKYGKIAKEMGGGIVDITYEQDLYGVYYATFTIKAKNKKETYTMPVKENISFGTYSYQVNHYVTWTNKGSLTDDYNNMVSDFCRVYNVGYKSTVLGGVNTDGSQYGATTQVDADGNLEYWFGETGAVYKENGMYADGYVFSMEVANNILISYYNTINTYGSREKADAALNAALLEAKAGSEWKKNVASDEYKEAYGNDGLGGGLADKYMITQKRLNKVISILGKGIVDKKLIEGLPNIAGLFDLGKIVGDLLADNGITMEMIANLDFDGVVALLESFGLDLDLMDLLEGFSNYQYSNVKPLMYFIKDEELRTYAYARYYGEIHGVNIGSVLIGDQVGHVTMSTSGLNAAENAFTLDRCYLLRAYDSYIPTMYPLFAARRYAYIFAGIIALAMVIYYYAQMKVNILGKQLDKLSTIGGCR